MADNKNTKPTDDADLWGYQCVERLRKDPSFADKCKWSRLDSWDWMNLLRDHPEYADKCDWSKLDYDAVAESCLLDEQPQLAAKCDWSRFSRSQKAELLLEHPEFGQYAGQRLLIVELGCCVFVELGRKVIPADDDAEEPVEDAKVSPRDRRRLYAVMNEYGIVHKLSVRSSLTGRSSSSATSARKMPAAWCSTTAETFSTSPRRRTADGSTAPNATIRR